MSTDFNIQSFWELITQHRIEIPIIQRDYAHGRKGLKDSQIRTDFVEALLSALKNEEKLHLDFIYGKIHGKQNIKVFQRNKDSIENLLQSIQSYASHLSIAIKYDLEGSAQSSTKNHLPNTFFIPLDGQQRLTTLFLLHWYLAFKAAQNAQVLLGFSYQTRSSSKEFCKALVNNGQLLEHLNGDSLSEQIINQSWYFSNWSQDPTVRGMLTVLDQLHEQLKEDQSAYSAYWARLTQQPLITFQFLDMENFELTDELYVKMNARGKALSTFENFKAWLQLQPQQNEKLEETEWHQKLDKSWMDLFWTFKAKETYEIDQAYYRFFKNIALFEYVKELQLINGKYHQEDIKFIQVLITDEFIPHRMYETKKLFNTKTLNQLFKLLNILSQAKTQLQDNNLLDSFSEEPFLKTSFTKLLLGTSSMSLPERTYLYAFVHYLLQMETPFEESKRNELKEWMRICRNLIFNTTIDNNLLFFDAIKMLDTLSVQHVGSIDLTFTNITDFSPFLDIQLKEEQQKIRLIQDDLTWKSLFLDYEQNHFLYGQIGFLIDMANEDISRFKEYADLVVSLFPPYLDSNPDLSVYVQRALLTKGDYLFDQQSSNRSFGSFNYGTLRLRNENWRKLFNKTENRELLQLLLDDLKNEPNLKQGLIRLIEESNITDWRRYPIQHPEIIQECWQKLIRPGSGDSYYLLRKKKRSGKHAELYTFQLYLTITKSSKLNALFPELAYTWTSRKEGPPHLTLGTWIYKKHEVHLIVSYNEKQQYKVLFKTTTDAQAGFNEDASDDYNLINLNDALKQLTILRATLHKNTHSPA